MKQCPVYNQHIIWLIVLLLLTFNSCKKEAGKGSPKAVLTDTIAAVMPFTMTMSPDTYTQNDTIIKGLITNNTASESHFGAQYTLEALKDGKWQEVIYDSQYPIAFNSLAYIVPPLGTATCDTYLLKEFYNFESGKYRIKKDIRPILTAEFIITDGETATSDIQLQHSDGDYVMTIEPEICNMSTDSVTVTITNNSPMEITPYNHYYIETVGEMGWERYYYPSMRDPIMADNPVVKGTSITFRIPLIATRFHKSLIVQGFKPGKYRVCKYAKIDVSAEFTITDDMK
ncbi:immunoglobulin-like domain-containing protein [Prevotella sp. 10(H)]|uniref:immunoglobulin-like domain-containing protein n=1 Tax=Prevotella sp. 10(H) TaxID=1158294 RepID=UPI0004A78736|nr:immunoglobulin-like domain-containing protein [Prevotella sp. 10(H)]